MRTGVSSLIFAVIAVGYLSSAADARPMHDRHSLDQILPQIRQHHPGTLYDADGPFIGQDGREHYRLKWMTPDGRVQWLDADAHSGHVTNAQGRYDSFDDGRGPPGDGNYDRDDNYRDNDGNRGNGKHRNNNGDDDRRDRFNNDGGFGNPFGGNGDDGRRRRGNDWNGNGNWDRGNRDDHGNGGYGGWQNNDGGGHRHHGHD